MTDRVEKRAKFVYAWMEDNVVTAILVCSGTAAILAVALTAALGLYSSVTFQQKTACTKDPGGPECAEIRQEVARAEPITNPCISYQRVTSRRGRNCPDDFVEGRQDTTRTSQGPARDSGGSTEPPPTPAPHAPSGGGGAGGPKAHDSPTPETPTAPVAPAPPTVVAPEGDGGNSSGENLTPPAPPEKAAPKGLLPTVVDGTCEVVGHPKPLC